MTNMLPRAIQFIALNDNNGDAERLNVESVSSYLTVQLISCVWRCSPDYVAAQVVEERLLDDEV